MDPPRCILYVLKIETVKNERLYTLGLNIHNSCSVTYKCTSDRQMVIKKNACKANSISEV